MVSDADGPGTGGVSEKECSVMTTGRAADESLED